MQKLLERLNLIQSAIYLDDEALIQVQIVHFPILIEHHPSLESRLLFILEALQSQNYAQAQQSINQLLNEQTQVSVYIDTESESLRFELAALEKKMAELQYQKDNCIQAINQFGMLYYAHLGQRLQQILQLHVKISHFYTQQEGLSEQEQHKAQQQFQEAQQQFQDFQQESQQQQDKIPAQQLDEEDLKRLKNAYRRASRLCHPDMVAEDLKEQAKVIFQELADAYQQQDVETVERIFVSLQIGGMFGVVSEKISDKEVLKQHIQNLRQSIMMIQNEIQEWEQDETYQLIQSLAGEYDEYFAQMAQELDQELIWLNKKWHELMG